MWKLEPGELSVIKLTWMHLIKENKQPPAALGTVLGLTNPGESGLA